MFVLFTEILISLSRLMSEFLIFKLVLLSNSPPTLAVLIERAPPETDDETVSCVFSEL